MEALLNQQRVLSTHINNFIENTNKTGKDKHTESFLQSRLDLLIKYWDKFSNNHDDIIAIATDENLLLPYFKESHFEDTELSYCEKYGLLTDMLSKFKSSSEVRSDKCGFSLSTLPKIQLNRFGGDLKEWPAFHDLFKSLIHINTDLTGSQKLYYLKTSLYGSAEQLLRNTAITDANYTNAWKLLCERYNNDRLLVTSYLRLITSMPPMRSESFAELRKLHDGIIEAVKALEALGRPVQHWDDWLVYTTVQKLDPVTRKDWENSLSATTSLPTFEALCAFLQHRVNTLEIVGNNTFNVRESIKPIQNKLFKKDASVKSHFASSKSTNNTGKCSKCNGKHLLLFCPIFRQFTTQQRLDFVTKEHLCFNCLRANHSVVDCPSPHRCKHCSQQHHSMLHIIHDNCNTAQSYSPNDRGRTPHPSTSDVEHKPYTWNSKSKLPLTSNLSAITVANIKLKHPIPSILLATARVILSSSSGKRINIRALIDQGSQATFLSSFVASYLQLSYKRVNIQVKGIASKTTIAKSMASITIQSSINTGFQVETLALVLPKLTKIAVPHKIEQNDFPHLQDLQLADPTFADDTPIDLIIGADLYYMIIREGLRIGTPTAQNTALGWILSGPTVSHKTRDSALVYVNHSYTDQSTTDALDFLLQKFWEAEDVPAMHSVLSEEDQACEDFYKATTQRQSDGRYVVRLPIRPEFRGGVTFGDSKSNAMQSLKLLERRFTNNALLKDRYMEFMQEYLQLNHMEVITKDNTIYDTSSQFYLPHHGVLNDNSTTTKLRVVFNGSRKSRGGLSLNDYLAVGPKLQSDLFGIVLKWRIHPVVLAADIRMMYRQIRVNDEDCDLQRIIWRASASEPMETYRLLTVTYGTTAAPYLAIRTLLQLAEDEESKYPIGAKLIRNHFYVDDVLFGAEDIPSALVAQRELVRVLEAGGFQLHKWASNSPEALQGIHSPATSKFLNLSEDSIIKTLGLFWNPTSDCFDYQVKLLDPPTVLTKRTLLSDVAKLYDPLGFLSPTIVLAKTFIQQLWLQKLDWDTPLPDIISNKWLNFRNELEHLQNVSIPRWIGVHSSTMSYELHAFSDASELAYSAVVYLRSMHDYTNIQLSLLCAKTKLAPLKRLSIPRLELMGAHLLSRLVNNVQRTLEFEQLSTYCWTDSLTVLTWLTSHPSKWKTFVANRVSQTLELVPNAKWKFVPSSWNPADCASRGVRAEKLSNHPLWWQGPTWLKSPSSLWPTTPVRPRNQNLDLEENAPVLSSTISVITTEYWTLIHKYSSLSSLLRITAWCHRFVHNCRAAAHNRTKGNLTSSEVYQALQFWVRHDQRVSFPKEYQQLSTGRVIDTSSSILRLSPIFESKTSTLHVGGRLQQSDLVNSAKHQLLLSKTSPLSKLIVQDAHEKTLHGGIQLTLSFTRQRFWILGSRDLIRQTIRRCVICFRQRASAQTQLMGILPSVRVKPNKPFLYTGIDYAGPILVRYGPGRGRPAHKAYIALFVCMSTKAIHLELVSDMTTDAFIASYKRFTARRGYCKAVYSDNATTFVGASKELRNLLFFCQSKLPEPLSNLLTSQETEWHFIPPHAPNFGGLWEAGVKSVKHHLKRVIGSSTLTFEELYTLLTQIEACVNSRPLYPLSPDADDAEVLTPGHFLIGSAPLTVPEPSLESTCSNRLSRWKLLHQMYEHFWRRWSADYLNSLQERTKWMKKQPNVTPGLLVLIRDDHTPPSTWALGRVISSHPGSDGLIRVVKLQSKGHTMTRPINKICALPIADNDNAPSNQDLPGWAVPSSDVHVNSGSQADSPEK